jgi:hypothetical protein
MKINQIISEIDRRGFLKGIGAASAVTLPGLAVAGVREDSIEHITKLAGTIWDMRRLGYSRSNAVTTLETKFGLTGEGLRVAVLICDLAWSIPKDHFTRNEFVQQVTAQASKNLPSDSKSKTSNKSTVKVEPQSKHYALRVTSRIKPNIQFMGLTGNRISSADGQLGNPKVTIELKTSQDGAIVNKKIITNSEEPSWDNAVLQAIDKLGVLPRDINGNVPPTVIITMGLRDY